jgi:hypothetical protein
MQTLLVLTLVATLGACGKAQEDDSEPVVEELVESQLEKDGTEAKVDLGSGGTTITTTDASGKTSQMEMGSADVSEADVGVAFYPGATRTEGGATRIVTPEGSSVTVMFHSDDPPGKVAAFYRERLQSQAAGKQFMDMGSGDEGTMLMLADDKAKSAIQVHVSKTEKGTDFQIVANRTGEK